MNGRKEKTTIVNKHFSADINLIILFKKVYYLGLKPNGGTKPEILSAAGDRILSREAVFHSCGTEETD